ncbi:hypothetical protein CLF_112941 [Clonorchis sinensis]|uniref:Uncharacterized protein n=1 Tax=Clonorchis sinensis TaxID=79923 RepID=G7YXB2_CLOSI|nr:hypothetical protein CLF_112941 [Clonorchis sinensis]
MEEASLTWTERPEQPSLLSVTDDKGAAVNSTPKSQLPSWTGSDERRQAAKPTDKSTTCVDLDIGECCENRTITENVKLPISSSTPSKVASSIVDTVVARDPNSQSLKPDHSAQESPSYTQLATLIAGDSETPFRANRAKMPKKPNRHKIAPTPWTIANRFVQKAVVKGLRVSVVKIFAPREKTSSAKGVTEDGLAFRKMRNRCKSEICQWNIRKQATILDLVRRNRNGLFKYMRHRRRSKPSKVVSEFPREHYAGLYSVPASSSHPSLPRPIYERPLTDLVFTVDIRQFLHKINPFCALGPDEVHPRILKETSYIPATHFENAANVFVMHGEGGSEHITRTGAKKDLDIWLSSKMSFSQHHEKSAQKAFAVLR